VGWDEVSSFTDAVDDVHDSVVPMRVGEFDYEIDTDDVPTLLWCGRRVKLADRSVTLRFRPIT
jgi:hypothetical protein